MITIQHNIHLLKQKSSPISLPFQSGIKDIIQIMIEATKSKDKIVGLAAPQLGINKRIILCSFTGETQDLEAMINPTYINNDTETEEDWEGCLSVPLTFAKVPRWKTIDVSYYNIEGNIINKQLSGFPARVYQHEHDHLEGILMTERASELKTFETEEEFKDFLLAIRTKRAAALKISISI